MCKNFALGFVQRELSATAHQQGGMENDLPCGLVHIPTFGVGDSGKTFIANLCAELGGIESEFLEDVNRRSFKTPAPENFDAYDSGYW